jgi:hypothetical protein
VINQPLNIPKERMLPAIGQVFKIYPKMISLLFFIALGGIVLSFYMSSLPNILWIAMRWDASYEYFNLRSGYMFLILGLGKIVGGYLGGYLCDIMTNQKVGAIILSLYYLGVLLSMIGLVYFETVVAVMLAAFIWGFQ